ncbi:hypothetical protein [Chryseobacterium profundimaris]|uniref:HTTM domain-containing protein n=1 Tax=Chryseobacterium profundimaris TaxID=1387275 RepID=A0ABY1PEH8_9FLAO|nr:hypothetical protein [Chryseobacterium profundimaris]SMP31248.1 hypothetical protein SAMN06264346_11387 [Chryseobacterium profundimaris]
MLKKNLSEKQIVYLIKGIVFFWLLTKIWSYKTWITERSYPVIPPVEMLEGVPNFLHQFLFGFSIVCLLTILSFKINRWLVISLFFSEIISCAMDTVRWQPWEYMYLCFLLVIIINFYKPKNIVLIAHLFLVSIYLFSGLHKFSRDFLNTVWLNMFLVNFLGLSIDFIVQYKLFFLGLLIPTIEVLLALLLLFSKYKKMVSYLLIVMHLCILIFIGPIGLQYNSVVWPWNLAMIFILLIVYLNPIKFSYKTVFANSYWLILWFIMPVLSLFGSWYQYFSFNLYSGKGDQMYICLLDNKKEFKPYFESSNSTFCKGKPTVNLQNWALKEIKSAPIPEAEIYGKIAVYLKRKYGNNTIKIILYNPRTRIRKEL